MENLIKMDDLGVPLFSETSIYKLLFFAGFFHLKKTRFHDVDASVLAVSAKQKLADSDWTPERPSRPGVQTVQKKIWRSALGRKKISQMRPKWDWKEIPAHPRKAKKNKLDIRRNIFQSHSCNRGFNKNQGGNWNFGFCFISINVRFTQVSTHEKHVWEFEILSCHQLQGLQKPRKINSWILESWWALVQMMKILWSRGPVFSGFQPFIFQFCS